MTTTTATIQLAGVGAVRALPERLHPVALAAEGMAVRTWGVVSVPDDGPPVLERDELTMLGAAELGNLLAESFGPAVYVVYRCPTAVTVHTRDMSHRPNLLGTLTVQTNPQIRGEWTRILHLRQYAARDAEVVAAFREAHHLAADATDGQVLLYALRNPLPDLDYVTAYARLSFLREHLRRERLRLRRVVMETHEMNFPA